MWSPDSAPVPEFTFTPNEVDEAMNAAILPVIKWLEQHSDHEVFVRMAKVFHRNLGQELAAIYVAKLKLARLKQDHENYRAQDLTLH